MNKKLADRIVVCRIAMFMKYPFWGNLVTRLKLKALEETDTWCRTAATDGREIFYCEEFMDPLSDKQIIFVLCHELLHVALDHICRGKTDDKMLSNIAADFVVNGILIKEGIGQYLGDYIGKKDLSGYSEENPLFKKVGTLYDPNYDGWTYEKVYDDLMQDENIKKNFFGKGGAINITFDSHIDGDGANGDPSISSEQLQAIRDAIREAMITASQSVGIGNVPGSIRRLLGDLLESKMDWRQLISAQIDSQIKNDYTFMRLGKRSFSSQGAIYPSQMRQPKIEACIALDMSGSIGPQEIREFFTEISGIVAQFESYAISVLCFDTKGYNFQTFTEDDGDAIFDYQVEGGGGTAFSGIFNYLKELDVVPKQLFVLTDGATVDWGDPDYCDTTFLIKNPRKIVAPYGVSVEFEV